MKIRGKGKEGLWLGGGDRAQRNAQGCVVFCALNAVIALLVRSIIVNLLLYKRSFRNIVRNLKEQLLRIFRASSHTLQVI